MENKIILTIAILFFSVNAYALDVALGIDCLVPQAEYFGATNENTEEQFNRLNWRDVRTKPTWNQLVVNETVCLAQYNTVQQKRIRDKILDYVNNDPMWRVHLELTFEMENQLRTLHSLPTISRQDFLQKYIDKALVIFP